MTRPQAPFDVAQVLAGLTVEEKASLLDGADFWRTTAVERLGVPAVMVSDGPHGLRTQTAGGDNMGVNASAPATCFPPAAGLASSWDPLLARRVGRALARECLALGVSVVLGPGVNMKRTPLCGRNFEYFSEDPLLAGDLAAAYVDGVQSLGVGTSLKHFAVNSQETDRMSVSADVDERTLREIYLPAFEKVVTASRPWTVMASYNRVNGVFASENPWLLTRVLRDEWGFDGLVVSDWGAVNDRAAGVSAGLDLEMPSSSGGGAARILDALADGTLTQAEVDRSVERVLRLVTRASTEAGHAGPADFDAHHALAREAAAASVVLLKNEGGILPLAPDAQGALAVVGELARTPRYQGAGSSQVNPTRLDNALGALRDNLSGRREVHFAPGYLLDGAPDQALTDEAVRVAAAAESVLVFLGLPDSYESEGFDRTSMDLPANQLSVLDAVARVNPRIVVVLSNGSVVRMTPWQDDARAVVEGWLLGQAGGSALADVLLGAAEPTGRLAETVPERLEDNPAVGSFPGELGSVRYGEGLLIGYRWYDAHQLPVAYPFGHGLSYTAFSYGDATVTAGPGPDPVVDVTVTVTNIGDRPGTETVQVYVAPAACEVFRPPQELRGFEQVRLEPGESAQVRMSLGRRAFAYWHVGRHDWVVAPGTYSVRIGASSRDIRADVQIALDGDDQSVPLTVDSAAETWLTHPEAGPWLRAALSGSDFEGPLFHPFHGPSLRAFPILRLSRMPGFPVREAQVRAAATRFAG